MPESPSWHLRGPGFDRFGLSEPDMRRELLAISSERLSSFAVRHGSGAWYPASDVMELFRNLARTGCYIRVGRAVEGPFTVPRAMDVLQERISAVRLNGLNEKVRVRIGRDSMWVTPREFASHCREQKDDRQPASPLGLRDGESDVASDAVFRWNTIKDEDVDAVFAAVDASALDQSPLNARVVEVMSEPCSTETHQQKTDQVSERLPSPGRHEDEIQDEITAGESCGTDPAELGPPVSTAVSPEIEKVRPTSTFTAASVEEADATELAEGSQADLSEGTHESASAIGGPSSGAVDDEQRPYPEGRPLPPSSANRRTSVRRFKTSRVATAIPESSSSSRGWSMLAASLLMFVVVSGVTYALSTLEVDDGSSDLLSVNLAQVASQKSAILSDAVPQIVEAGVPSGFLFQPRFETSFGCAKAGVVFAARRTEASQPVLVGALRVLGPAGGLERPIDSLEVFTALNSVALKDCKSGDVRSSVPGLAVIIPGAKPFPEVSLHGDVFGFRPQAKNCPLSPLQVSLVRPWFGETVWLLACKDVGQVDAIVGTVSTFENGRLVVQLTKPMAKFENVDSVAGAPIVNAANEVIGVSTVIEWRDGQATIIATPSERFADYL